MTLEAMIASGATYDFRISQDVTLRIDPKSFSGARLVDYGREPGNYDRVDLSAVDLRTLRDILNELCPAEM